ncbi:MAG: putative metal-dependent hydrolase [Lewinella sp.]|nr:putative metal-dependent hydrolase [Lewinella sp.]
MPTLNDLKYPIGPHEGKKDISDADRKKWIDVIARFPGDLRAEVTGLVDSDLALRYRPGGWSIRELIHHCADSHMNSFIRFKLALTEDEPTIKPYDESEWAILPDSADAPISWSLQILDGVHARWVFMLRRLEEEDFERTFIHPEGNRTLTLDKALDLYQWHCRHHLTHVRQAKQFQEKFPELS